MRTKNLANLKNRIEKSINEHSHEGNISGYNDKYDGFAHQSYAGLLDDVLCELFFGFGYNENSKIPTNVIDNLVFNMID